MAFGGFVSVYLSQFVALAKKLMDEEKERMAMSLDMAGLYGYGKDGQRTGGRWIEQQEHQSQELSVVSCQTGSNNSRLELIGTVSYK